jgi:hypothetical protein
VLFAFDCDGLKKECACYYCDKNKGIFGRILYLGKIIFVITHLELTLSRNESGV